MARIDGDDGDASVQKIELGSGVCLFCRAASAGASAELFGVAGATSLAIVVFACAQHRGDADRIVRIAKLAIADELPTER